MFNSGSENVNSGMKGLMVISIFIYLVSQSESAMWQYFIMIRSLQLIMHLPMFRIILPANLLTLIAQMIPIMGFDILESFFNWDEQSILKFDFDRHDFKSDSMFSQL